MSLTKRNLIFLLLVTTIVAIGLMALPLRHAEAKRLVVPPASSSAGTSLTPGRINGTTWIINSTSRQNLRPGESLSRTLFPQLSSSSLALSNIVGTRIVRVVGTTLQASQNGTVIVEFDSQGDENALGFSLNFDQTKLTFVSAVKGTDANAAGATMNVNSGSVSSGRLGLAIGLPAGSQLTAGTKQIAVITFSVAAGASGSTIISFGNAPIFREIVDVNAGELTAQYDQGTINITALPSPVPTLTSLNPSSALIGGSGFDLTVLGTNFVDSSIVRVNGADRPTTFVSSTQLTAQISAADIQTSGSLSVTVFTPAPGGGTSNAVNLPVNNSTPTVTSLTPASTVAGGSAFTLTISGTGFLNNSVVRLNGSDRSTTFVNSTQLTAQIGAADIVSPGTAAITVFNPAPGGGSSNSLTLTIGTNPAFRVVRVVGGTINAGQNNSISVELDAQGDENALGFSLNFDPAKLTFISAVRGSGAPNATLNVNTSATASGHVGLALANQAGESLPPGTREIVVLTFSVPANGSGSTQITFGDSPVGREVVDVSAASLSATYAPGTFNITALPNPVPGLTGISPATTTVGGSAFTLTVNGSNFVSGSIVRFNGADRSTTFVSSTQLTASITAADIQTTGSFPVTVFNPTPGGGTSNATNLAVNNPTPTITSLSPIGAQAGGPAFTLTVNGSGFVNGSVVRLGGSDRSTAFVNNTQLTAQITAADISSAGSASVSVFTPAPGGGSSNTLNFAITTNPAFRIVRVLGGTFNAGQNNTMSVELDAQGDENALGFSLNFDPAKLTFVSAVIGNGIPNATFNVNPSSVASGHLGIAVANPAGQSLTPGTRQIALITFNVPNNGNGSTAISFGDSPIPREIVDVNAGSLTATYASGTVNITPLPNPVPTLTILSPASALVGGSGFTLNLIGNGFVSDSVVRFNGVDRATTFVSSSQLTIEISAADIQTTGSFPITVFNPTPGGGTSNAINLAVNNPTPTITSLSPASTLAGGPAFTLTVNGTGFVSGSVVRVNGNNRTTTFVNSTKLTAEIPASDIGIVGSPAITVLTPTPGGGASNTLNLTINSNPALRFVRVVGGTISAGQNNLVSIELDAQGDENALGFSLDFDPAKLTFVSAVSGSGAPNATLNVNALNATNGHVGLALANPTGQTLVPGTRQIMVVTFNVPANGNGSTVINFGDSPIPREIVNVSAVDLGATYNSGTFNITPLPSPVPTLTGLSPATVIAGSPGFTLTLNGSGFVSGSVVRLNGADRPTTYISGAQLAAEISVSDIQSAGTAPLTVFNPAPGGGTSNSLALTVNNPQPTVTTISPASVLAGGPAFSLTVNGTGFNSSSAVRLGGINRATTFVNSTRLLAQIEAADISTAGIASITVFNPTPGGGTSTGANLTINTNPAFRILRVIGSTVEAGQNLTVNVEMDAQGDENALGFSLNFDPTKLTFVSAVKGSGAQDAQLNFNSASAISGHLGAALGYPAGEVFSAGTRQLLVLTFSVPLPVSGVTNIGFGDSPIGREIVNSNAGLLGATYVSGNININRPAPVLTSLSPSNLSTGAGNTSLTINGSKFVSESIVRIDGTPRSTTFVNSTQLTVQIAAAEIQSPGTFTVSVFTPAPGGGTSSTLNLPVTNPSPAITTISPDNAMAGDGGFNLTVNGSNFFNGSIVRLNGLDRPTTFVSATQLTAQISAADIQTAGISSITVFNSAPGGGTSSAISFTVNNPSPTLASISPTNALVASGSLTLAVSGTGFVSGSVVRWNGVDRLTTFISGSELSAAIPANDLNTTGSISITVFNPAPGGGSSNTLGFEILNPVPTINNLSPAIAIVNGPDFTLTINGSGFVNGAVVKIDGVDRSTAFISSTQIATQILSSDLATVGTLAVTVTNPAPGGGTSSALNLAINNPTPTISSLSSSNAITGDAAFTLTVTGNNFINGSVVRFAGSDRLTSFISGSQLTAEITAADLLSAGTFPITVFTPAPGGGVSNALNFSVVDPNPVPVINSLSPDPVATGGPDFTLTVNGSNFINGSVVRVDGNNRATSFVSATQLTAQLLASDTAAAGSLAVTVFNPAPGGGLSAGINLQVINPAPAIISVSPVSALVGGAAFTVTVTGTNFVSSSVVKANGSDRTTTFVSNTQLTAQIPASDLATAGILGIAVTNPAPGGGTSNTFDFAVNNPVPAVTAISPDSVQVGAAGVTLTVNGNNFFNGSVVRFNGSDRPTTFVSASQLTAEISAADVQTAGTPNITVFNPAPGGGVSNNFNLTVHNTVSVLNNISPSTAIAGGAAFTLIVNGSNFINGSIVRWNGSARTTTFVNSGQLTAQITSADISAGGTFPVSVFTPAPGGGDSNAIDFTVITPNPSPTIVSLSPFSAIAGGASFTLTINGSNFVNGSVVRWDGSERTTSFISNLQLQAQITASDIQAAGSHSVTVFNPVPGGGVSSALTFVVNIPGPGPATMRFASATYQFAESLNGLLIDVVRTGDTTDSVSVDFMTDDSTVFIPCVTPTGGADQRCDFATKGGTLTFAAGETSKSITLLNTDDAYVEGIETFTVTLSNPISNTLAPVAIGTPAQATIMILDNDSVVPTANPIDQAQYFVNQHYMDFLSRLPDAGGLGYWTNEISSCGNNPACINSRRIGVSAAFFIESEFQQTGYVVYRMYKAAFGTKPNYQQFMPDRSQLVAGPQLAASTLSFATRFTLRPAFKAVYPDSMTPSEFVNELFDKAQLLNSPNERQQAINDLTSGAKTRAQVLLDVIQINEFKQREMNSAFVLMEYFGYLRRDPDPAGFDFWVNVLNNRDPNNYRGMVCSFITSREYQQRFSSVTTRSNSDCGQ